MGPAYYVIAILGCGEGDAACQQIGLADSRYESLEACNAATAAAVGNNVNLAFPVVAAQCRRSDSDLAGQLLPGDVDLPPADVDRPARPVRRAAAEPVGGLRL